MEVGNGRCGSGKWEMWKCGSREWEMWKWEVGNGRCGSGEWEMWKWGVGDVKVGSGKWGVEDVEVEGVREGDMWEVRMNRSKKIEAKSFTISVYTIYRCTRS